MNKVGIGLFSGLPKNTKKHNTHTHKTKTERKKQTKNPLAFKTINWQEKKISAKGKNHKSMKLNKLQLDNMNLKVHLWTSKQQ